MVRKMEAGLVRVERHAMKRWWSRWDSNPRPSRLSPGRAPQTLDHDPVLPRLDLPSSAHGLGPGPVCFFVHQSPLPSDFHGFLLNGVVVAEALFHSLRV